MADQPIQSGDVDNKAQWDALNRLRGEVQEALAGGQRGGGTSDTTTVTLTGPVPCPVFIVARRVKKRGERVTMCIQFPAGEDVQSVKVIVWRHNKANTSYVERYEDTFRDITDAERAAGSISREFGRTLPFNRNYTATRLITTDENGAKAKAPEEDPSPSNNPPPFNYGVVSFSTGAPGLDGPAKHNFIRNGRLNWSQYAWRMLTAPTPDNRQLEAHGWFINCDRNVPIAAVGHPQHNPDCYWNKAQGTIVWRSALFGISQRIPHRIIRPLDVIDILWWADRTFTIDGLRCDLLFSIAQVFDSRSAGGSLFISRLVTERIFGFGDGPNSPVPVIPTLEALPPSEIDPGSGTIESGFAKPVTRSLVIPASYTPSATPNPVSGRTPRDSSGLWMLLEMTNIQGTARIVGDRFRCGYGQGDWTPHSKETQLGDEDDDTIGPPDGGGRAGSGTAYNNSDNTVEPGTGGILRPNALS